MISVSIGSCIYCGSTSNLEDEHVIPYALGGDILLLKASCRSCAEVTSAFEQRVLRGFMLDARIVGNSPTRSPRKRPSSLPLQVESMGELKAIELPVEEHPGFLLLPLLQSAGIFSGRTWAEGINYTGREVFYFGKDPASLATKLQIQAMHIRVRWTLSSFARLLAKIAYGYSVAVYGLMPRAEVVVLPLILGTANDASHWLGSVNFNLEIEARNPTHALGCFWTADPSDDEQEILVVRIKLYASSGATGYEIAVRRREKM